MMSLMLPGMLAFLVVLYGMPSLILVAKRKHLLDEPTEARKLHHRAVPTVGGVMVFAGLMVSVLVGSAVEGLALESRWIGTLGAMFVVFLMGVKDDIVGMGPYRKLLIHLGVGLFLVMALDWRIKGFGGLFGLDALPLIVSWAFSLFVYVVIVNAVNLIDGIDGLAGGFGMILMGGVAHWFYLTGDATASLIAMATLGALGGFLVFNYNPAKIFLGDSGALILGLLAYVFAVAMMDSNVAPDVAVSPPVAAMSLLAYPLVDTLRVFTLRVLQGRSPFSPDRQHIHHAMIDLGWNHRQVSGAVWGYTYLFTALAFQPIDVLEGQVTVHFALLLGTAFGISIVPKLMLRFRKSNSENAQENSQVLHPQTSIRPRTSAHAKPKGQHVA